jgi:hypothetical protein
MSDRRERIIDKILSRIVEKDCGYISPCWLWLGPTSGKGRGGSYGRMCLDGITVAVHIVMYVCYFGYIPPKKQVDHKCNIRNCCNPDHLEAVTHKENMKRRDARRKDNVTV